MPIRSAAGHEIEKLRKRTQARDVLGAVARVEDFDPVESERHEGCESLAPPVLSRMRNHGKAAAVVNELHAIIERKSLFLHVRGASRAKKSVKRLPLVARPAAGDKGARHVRTANGSVACLSEHRLNPDGNAQPIELLDDAFRSGATGLTHVRQRRLQSVHANDVKAEDVDLSILTHHAQLDARNDAQAEARSRVASCGHARQRVVIRECQRPETGTHGRLDYPFRSQCAVGGGRMGVQVDGTFRSLVCRRGCRRGCCRGICRGCCRARNVFTGHGA